MLVRMWSKGNTLPLLMGVQTLTATLEIHMTGSQNIVSRSTTNPAIPFLGIYLKDTLTYYKDTCSTIFIAGFFL